MSRRKKTHGAKYAVVERDAGGGVCGVWRKKKGLHFVGFADCMGGWGGAGSNRLPIPSRSPSRFYAGFFLPYAIVDDDEQVMTKKRSHGRVRTLFIMR